MRSLRKPLAFFLLVSLFPGSLLPVAAQQFNASSRALTDAARDEDDEDQGPVKPQGLQFRLSQAPDQPEPREARPTAPAQSISQSEIEAVLGRLPALKEDEGDR